MEAFNTFMDVCGWEILGLILGGIATYIGYQAKIVYERAANTKEKKETVAYVVNAIEQLAKINGWNSEQKKAEAVKRAVAILNGKGIVCDELEIDTMIESVVNGLQQGFKEETVEETGPVNAYFSELIKALKGDE